jgi:excisionase family DNA binding protein
MIIYEKKWITATEAQQYLNVGRTKLWQLRINSELKYAVHGRKVYILRKSMDEYIERYSMKSLFELKEKEVCND